MRGLLVGVTVAVALIVGVLAAAPVHAEEPDTTEGEALAELVFAGAPLSPQRATALTSTASAQSSTTASGLSSSISAPPAGSTAAAASESVPQAPELGPQVAPQFPEIPNPLDWLKNLDPRKWAGDILNAILTTIGKALLEAIRGFVDWALGLGDSSLNFVTRTPAEGTYGSPTVRSLWDFSRALVNVALAVIVMWGGFNVMVKEHTRSPYHEVMEL
ncbi:MAG: hypothetical protein ACE5IZ_10535, partial [Dehalococcoidia bacterium]